MENRIAQLTAELGASWPAYQIWWVPRAVGRPVVTWHARRRDADDGRNVIHADSADELAWMIELAEG